VKNITRTKLDQVGFSKTLLIFTNSWTFYLCFSWTPSFVLFSWLKNKSEGKTSRR
jgi:hypothetical protein